MKKWQTVLVWCLFIWAFSGLVGDLPDIISGVPFAWDYLCQMFPPDWHILPELVDPLLETFKMGILATCISACISIPLAFLAAKSSTPHISIYLFARFIVAAARGIPTLLWAILFVSMVGLGPLAGVFALVVHCVGALAKGFSESIESLTPHVADILEAMYIDGASKFQSIQYGLLPIMMPFFMSRILYYFEWSIRVGTILGLVGAGGLGLRLIMSIRMFRRQETATILILILALVTCIDMGSRLIRRQLLEEM